MGYFLLIAKGYVIINQGKGISMKDTKIQWHPAFIAAMNLELKGYRDSLTFHKEYNLNTKPLEIDLLVIKKEASIRISNEIGEFFRGHNILEYKSPDDALDIDVMYKSEAYASLYKSYGETVDAIRADDMTVSVIRDTEPAGLFRYFREHGYKVTDRHKGIYEIEGSMAWYPTQIIVTNELDKKLHIWLRALSQKLDKYDLQKLLDDVSKLTEKFDKEMASSVLEVSIRANREAVDELKGEGPMFEVLMEIMEPKIEEIRINSRMEGREEGIKGTINALRNFQHGDPEIKTAIMKQYGLTEEEANDYLQHS